MSHDFLRISGHLDIVSKSLKILMHYSNLQRFSSGFSLGVQTHACNVVYMQLFVVEVMNY